MIHRQSKLQNATPPNKRMEARAIVRVEERIARLRPAAAERRALANGLARLAAAILQANRTMNLTGDREPELFAVRHLEDALAAAAAIEQALGRPPEPGPKGCPNGWTIADVGAGGGIPGLVWPLLWPGARVVLIESRLRRARFLARTAETLALRGVQVLEGRAERWAHDPSHRETYDLVTARALAALPVALEWTLPFARIGGRVALIQSAAIEAELPAAARAQELLGGAPAPPRLLPYSRSDAKPCVVCLIEKSAPTPAAYPRAAGKALKRPLA
jgi:16S rRNA (guanine527-N7)-methyltransferase